MTAPSSVVSARLDDFVADFEAARARGDADPADFLPEKTDPLYLHVLRELVRVDLERGWDEGRPRSLDDYAARFPELFRDEKGLKEVAFEEYRLRRQAGQDPSPAEYAERFGISVGGWPAPRAEAAGLEAAAASYQDFVRTGQRGAADVDAWAESQPGEGARLLRDLHRADPKAAGRLAEGVLAMPEVGGDFLGFLLVEELGRGAFGRVFLARQGELANRPVALKVAPDVGGESQTLAQLQHTHIVPIHSVHKAGPFQAVCMPYFGRTTLADVLKEISARPSLPRSGLGLVSTLNGSRRGPTPPTGRATEQDMPATVAIGPRQAGPDSQRPATERPAVAGLCEAGPARGEAGHQSGLAPVLRERLGGMTYAEAVLWLGRGLADGLAHAHERGILHRDLKPANVLLTDDGVPMLLDFNLAEDVKARGRAEAAAMGGTLPYMAPEQMEAFRGDHRAVDERCDIFSLGIILYELLTGRPPFPQRHLPPSAGAAGGKAKRPPLHLLLREMIEDRRRGAPSPRAANRAVAPAADAIVRRCLDPDPARRYQTARQLQEDLQRQLDLMPLLHTPDPSLRERVQKWVKHHPRALRRGAGLGSLLLVALALWFGVRALLLSRSEAALRTLDGFRDDAAAARTALAAQGEDGEQRARGAARARQALARYGVLDDPRWGCRPELAGLGAEGRRRALGEIGELLLLLARAEGWSDAGDSGERAARAETALGLNSLAEACYADAPPAALWLQRADLLRQLGRQAEAESARARSARAEPRTAHDHYLLAREHTAAGRFREAVPLLQKAVRLDPQDFGAWLLLGACHDEAQQDAQAINSYSVCAALAPRVPWGHFNRGLAYLRQKDFEKAAADFDRVLELEPRLSEAYVNRALALQGMRKFKEAVDDLTKALDAGAAPRVYFMRARARDRAGDKDGARQDREEGLRRDPGDDKGWVARGLARLADDPKGALADFEQALKLNPRSRAALQNKAHVLAERLDRPEEAIAALDRALALYPDHVPALGGRAVLHARLGRREAALKDARAALERDGRAHVRYQAACAYALTSKQTPADRGPALELLADALRQGYGVTLLTGDTDLAPLRPLPEFQRLAAAAAALRPASR